MVQHLLGRRGAARIAQIPPEVLDAINEGLVSTVNLNEFLALDLPRLARNVAHHIGVDDIARCWAAQWVMFTAMPLEQKLPAMHRFAADPRTAATSYIVRRARRSMPGATAS
jgi:hypothetical protein